MKRLIYFTWISYYAPVIFLVVDGVYVLVPDYWQKGIRPCWEKCWTIPATSKRWYHDAMFLFRCAKVAFEGFNNVIVILSPFGAESKHRPSDAIQAVWSRRVCARTCRWSWDCKSILFILVVRRCCLQQYIDTGAVPVKSATSFSTSWITDPCGNSGEMQTCDGATTGIVLSTAIFMSLDLSPVTMRWPGFVMRRA